MSVSSQADVSGKIMIRLLLSDGSTMVSRYLVTHAPRCIVSQRVLVIETKGFWEGYGETATV
jgi:hypothetical protein